MEGKKRPSDRPGRPEGVRSTAGDRVEFSRSAGAASSVG
ncbi:phage DNA packaging protein J [Streptomyces sp. NBC_00209]